jgi:hypothetical protein
MAKPLALLKRSDLSFPSRRGISIDGNCNCPRRRRCAATDLGDPAKDRCVKIACAALLTNADGHVFEDDKTTLMPQRFVCHAALTHGAVTVFAGKVVHAQQLLGFVGSPAHDALATRWLFVRGFGRLGRIRVLGIDGLRERNARDTVLNRCGNEFAAAAFFSFLQIPENRSQIIVESSGIRIARTPNFVNDRV